MTDDRTLLVRHPEQRSRIACAQKELHSVVAALDVLCIHTAGSRREECDLRKAHALCTEAQELIGSLLMAAALPCGTCEHECVEHDGGVDGFGDDDCREPCRRVGCTCPDFTCDDDGTENFQKEERR